MTYLKNSSNSPTNEELLQLLSSYFTQRGSFLAQVIRADLEALPHLNKQAKITSNNRHNGHNSHPTNGATTNKNNGNAHHFTPVSLPPQPQQQTLNVESILINLVVEQTGYPPESISLDAKLLDDLNLDSIKAGELIAAAAKTCNLAGSIDPSTLANVTLKEIAQVLRSAIPASTQTTPLKQYNDPIISKLSQHQQASVNVTQRLLKLVEERTGFPQNTLNLELRLLDDLNLDSIKAADLIALAAKQLGVSGQLDPSTLANATLGDIIAALEQTQSISQPAEQQISISQKTTQENTTTASENPSSWVRNFAIDYIPQSAPQHQTNWSQARILIVCDQIDNPLSQALSAKLQQHQAQVEMIIYEQVKAQENRFQTGFTHYLALLPSTESQQKTLPLAQMLTRLKSIATLPLSNANCSIAYVQFGGGRFGSQGMVVSPEVCCAGSFARSLHLERPKCQVRVVDLAKEIESSRAAELVIQELSTTEAIVTVGYDEKEVRLVPQARLQQPATYQTRSLFWSAEDVILVTGGAKGITAECAIALAKTTGVKMALVGRSSEDNSDVSQTLKRFQAEGLTCRYYACDIADAEAVVELVQKITAELGVITGVVHGAGLNTPRRVEQVSLEAAQKEVSPKVLGAYNLLQALAATPPKLIATFSSIIGVTGMPGNTWYAFANESLALLLRHFQAQHPDTQVVSLAYSVWDEVGMGARMGSIKILERMGINPIPLKEGVARFLKLFQCDPKVVQVVIVARLAGLDTWSPVPLPTTETLRFIGQVLSVEPNVELKVRTHLSLERDHYVKDHIWRGSYLFPTVFGLEAMAQATAYVTGEMHNKIVRIEDISLRRPIVVNPTHGVEIEIHAEVMEAQANGERPVKVSIRTEQTGFATDHFAATLIIGDLKPGVRETLQLGEPLAINPKTDLYGSLLFQGERFQRMGEIYSLNQHKSVFRSYARSSETDLAQESFGLDMDSYLLLGDPYLRDVLLQSVQLTIPQHICLPVEIGKIEFFQNPNPQEEARIVTVLLLKREDREYISEVFTTDEQGCIIEKLTGYRLRILEEHSENPTAEELANPEQRDSNILQEKLNSAFEAFGLEKIGIALGYTPNLQILAKKQRRQQEKPIIAQAIKAKLGLTPEQCVDFQIKTLGSGKPELTGSSVAGLNLSLSHCDRYCLSAVGDTPQGVDIELITLRSREDWVALLSFKHSPIIDELVAQGDTLERAGTRIWSALEAVRKAFNGSEPTFSIVASQKDSVLLQAEIEQGNYLVVTLPVKLTRYPERMIALMVAKEQAVSVSSSPSPSLLLTESTNNHDAKHRSRYTHDGPQGQLVYEQRFQVSFKDSGSISRRVYFSQYFRWVGKIREIPMESIASQMLSDFLTGDWGMVTNAVSLRVLGEATSYDTIQARAWVGNVVNSSFDTYIEFCKVNKDQSLERIALAEVKATWVRLMSYGVPTPMPFPSYLQEYLDRFAAKEPASLDLRYPETLPLPPLPATLGNVNIEPTIYQSPLQSRYGKLLYSETFQTTLEESNLVGNVYYGNYFIWQGRILDLFLYSVAPEYLRVSNAKGELICLYTRMDYLREAMPFDKIRVLLYVKSISECGALFSFEFFREQPDGHLEKLHVGQQEAIWACRSEDGTPVPTPWPAAILEALMNMPSLREVSVKTVSV